MDDKQWTALITAAFVWAVCGCIAYRFISVEIKEDIHTTPGRYEYHTDPQTGKSTLVWKDTGEQVGKESQ